MAMIYLASNNDYQSVVELANKRGIDFSRFEKDYGVCFVQKSKTYFDFLSDLGREYAGKPVMVIDDDPSMTELTKPFLDGCVVYAFSNPSEALKRYKELKPEVVITDLQMPEMDGFDVIKAIREIEGEW